MTQPETHDRTSGSTVPPGAPGPKREVNIRLFARTDVGQVREHNEDNFLVADLTRRARGLLEANRTTNLGTQGAVFAVCDGMGGAAAGEIASQLAVDILYERLIDGLEEHALSRDALALRLVRAVEAAGLRIFHEAKVDRSRRGMGTTVTAAAIVDDILFLAQVGDSRGYILRGGKLVQVTRDQSLVNQLIEAGQLTEEEAETYEHNNIILQALGTADTVHVDLTYVELRQGDLLLLCSDGLSGMVRSDEIREILASSTEPLDICRALTERANQAGGHDNITVIVAAFDGEALKPFDRAAHETDPLKYRKYTLAEISSSSPTWGPSASNSSSGDLGRHDSAGDVSSPNVTLRPRISAAPSNSEAHDSAARWHDKSAARAHEHDERIDIPGTRVPPWMVFSIIAGVVVVLVGTAFLLLR